MPSRSRSRGRPAKRGRRSPSVQVWKYPSRSRSAARRKRKVRISGTHSFTRYATESVTKQCTGVTQAWAEEFTFDKVAGYTEFTALFDQYKINSVTIAIQLINNPDAAYPFNGTGSSVTINPTNWFPKLWYIRDYDGGSADTFAAMKERQGVKFCVLKPNVIKRFVIKPKCLIQTYRTATSTGYAPKTLSIDLANVDVPHYGMNFLIDTLNVDPQDTYPFNVRIEYKYNFTLSGVR